MMTSYFFVKLGVKVHLILVKMAVKGLRLLATVAVLFCFYAVVQLLYVLFVFVKNPRRALRKTARDSKLLALSLEQKLLVWRVD